MTKKTLYLIGIALTIIIGTYLYVRCCCDARKNTENSQLASLSDKYSGALSDNRFSLGTNDFSYSCADNFRFSKDGFNILLPVGDSIDIGINSVKQYLLNNPNLQLVIKGLAGSGEKNSSAESVLGMARATSVKDYFVSKGFDASRILTLGDFNENLTEEDGMVYGSIKYDVKQAERVANAENFENFKKSYNANPISIRFETNNAEAKLSADNSQSIEQFSSKLKKYGNGELTITGHADNVGSNAYNLTLGQKRAMFLKDLFVKNGFDAAIIKTKSKGEEEPIANNDTEEGRAKNRRATVTID
ncbi:MAG: OmpA family protein [Bacteroidales bacterium]|nr:OmpA family protein [Bacteroidales bacterium]